MSTDRPTLLIALEPRILSSALERVLGARGFDVTALEDPQERGPHTDRRYDVVVRSAGAHADLIGSTIIELYLATGEVIAKYRPGPSMRLASVAEMLELIDPGAGPRVRVS
jgi:hypothetical protein